jgi:hypothetical protein
MMIGNFLCGRSKLNTNIIMKVRFQINYTSKGMQFFETEDFKKASFDVFKKIGHTYEFSLNNKVFTIERVDAVFDMFSIKQDGYTVSKIYCGLGNKVKNERIIKYLESQASGGKYPNTYPLFHMPQSDYFLVVMKHLYLTEKEIIEISQHFYAGLINQEIKI